jgi:hypothetical protein
MRRRVSTRRNLENWSPIYEADAKQAEERLQKMKELSAQKLITRIELETSEESCGPCQRQVL